MRDECACRLERLELMDQAIGRGRSDNACEALRICAKTHHGSLLATLTRQAVRMIDILGLGAEGQCVADLSMRLLVLICLRYFSEQTSMA